jgi:hypothetical protein
MALSTQEILEQIMDRLPVPCALPLAASNRFAWSVWKGRGDLRIAQHRLDDDAIVAIVNTLQEVIQRPVQSMLFDMPFLNSGISFASRFTVEPAPLSPEERRMGRKSIRVTACFKTQDGLEDVTLHVVPHFSNAGSGWYQLRTRIAGRARGDYCPYASLAQIFHSHRQHVDPDEDAEPDRRRFRAAVYGPADDYEPSDGDF